MMEEESGQRPHQEMESLSLDEKKFLLAVERGDVASSRRLEVVFRGFKVNASLIAVRVSLCL